MAQVQVIDIVWEADDMADVADIPTDLIITIPDDILLNNEDTDNFIEDEISNVSGFTHLGWSTHTVLRS